MPLREGNQDWVLVTDFDSTVAGAEILDLIAQERFQNDPDREEKLGRFKGITNGGMCNKVPFSESLRKRLEMVAPIPKSIIDVVVEKVRELLSPSFLAHRDFFKENFERIFVVSGGFGEVIRRTMDDFKLPDDHIFANEFVYDGDSVVGYDSENPLAGDEGKVVVVRNLIETRCFNPKQIHVIGDGGTDKAIVEAMRHDHGERVGFFGAYTEHFTPDLRIQRQHIIDYADQEIRSFDDFLEVLRMAYVRE